MAFNVEYQLQVLRCKTRALEEAELEAIAELKSMDEVLPRPSADAQKELLDRVRSGGNDEPDAEVAKEFSEGAEQKW
jgi:hypothetical protein